METINLPEKENSIYELINFATSEIERKYGTGKGDGETPKDYHNLIHTQDTISAGGQIANLAVEIKKIEADDIDLVRISAAGHDIEQNLKNGENEDKSGRIIEDKMRASGLFSDEDVSKVKIMISATKVYFENDNLKQSATEDYLTKIMADADLSALGNKTEIYWDRALRLFNELRKKGNPDVDAPTKEELIALCHRQIILLSNHQYYTDEAKELFPHQPENLAFVQGHLKELENS